jgi:hypothetical protein
LEKQRNQRLVGLTPGVNFTNIFRAAFVPIFLRQKITNLKCKHKKTVLETFVRKSRMQNVGEIDRRSQSNQTFFFL